MEEYLTPQDISTILNIGKNKTYNLINNKDFPKIRIGNSIRIPISKFDEYMSRHLYKTIDI